MNDSEKVDQWYDRKSMLMEEFLGPEHDMVMHALLPFIVGGGLDLYYYPNGISGTAIATKELSNLPGSGSSNDIFTNYELVMFTRQALDLDGMYDDGNAFAVVHRKINQTLNLIARYSLEANLNPKETCEFPEDMPDVGGRCLIFDSYPPEMSEDSSEFGLLLIIEIFHSEMQYAMKHGGAKLIKRLKDRKYYPYSDMDRKSVA